MHATRRWWFLAAGGMVALAAALAACGSGSDESFVASGGGRDGGPGATKAIAEGPAYSVASAPAPAMESRAADSGTSGGGAPGEGASQVSLERKIIFTASMAIAVPDVQQAFSSVATVARDAGGYVERSTLSGNPAKDRESVAASLTLRVPSVRYDDALMRLRTLPGATVTHEQSKSSEVTEQYTDLASRLRNLERTEGRYLELLQQARTIQDILTVNDRLDSVRLQIEQVQGKLNLLDNLADMASIDVSLMPDAPEGGAAGDPNSVVQAFRDAWSGSLNVVEGVLRAAAVVLVAAVWLAAPLAVIVVAAWVLRTRRGARTAP